MEEVIRLSWNEGVPERPFTCPDHIGVDKAVLDTMVRELFKHLPNVNESQPYYYFYPSADNWQKRVLLTRLGSISCGTPITVVGFFGKRRFPVSQEVYNQIFEFGRVFERQIPQMPAMLGYYSWMLSDEMNYANLVLMQKRDAISQWQESKPHDFVKGELSTQYYDCVRLRPRFVSDVSGVSSTRGSKFLRTLRSVG